MYITKADGTTEQFQAVKLISSLKKAGATRHEIQSIVQQIESSLTDGISTQNIYQRAFTLLRESNDPVAAKYSLRRAVIGLGPTGFPFEDYLGRLFEAQGYKTKRRLILKGKCTTHEIDLAAYSPTHSFVAEAKFHARPGMKSDIQVALYSYARYLDLQSQRICKGDSCGIISLYVITNTKFTTAAIKYAACAGITLIDWDYPRGNSLQDMIEKYKVYPLTVLTSISSNQKQTLLKNGVITCSEIVKNPQSLAILGLSSQKIDAVLKESAMLAGLIL